MQTAIFDADEPITRFAGEHEFLSNFFRLPLTPRGPWWEDSLNPVGGFMTVEHAYQAAKVEPATEMYAEHYRRIAEAGSPGHAKRLASARDFAEFGATLRAGWEQEKVLVMLACLRAKFDQDGPLASKLMATGRRVLVEGNTWGDRYWGVANGGGKNMLGRLLMLVRAENNCALAAGLPADDLRRVWRG